MKIVPIAFESMGVRSSCTYVETKDLKIVLDPGAALGSRYKLEPHQREQDKLTEKTNLISEYAKKADLLTISHYHYDHYRPSAHFWQDKIVFVKHPKKNINRSQKERAQSFFMLQESTIQSLQYADNSSYEQGNTVLTFSEALPHGEYGTKLGNVVMVSIQDDINLLFCSDIAGVVHDRTKDVIISLSPDVIIMDGPSTYLMGWRISWSQINQSKQNLLEIMEKTDVKTIILDHHYLRDKMYLKHLLDCYIHAKELGITLCSGAEYLGGDSLLLEAYRKELYAGILDNEIILRHNSLKKDLIQ